MERTSIQVKAENEVNAFLLSNKKDFSLKILNYCSEEQIKRFLSLDGNNKLFDLISNNISQLYPSLTLYFIIKNIDENKVNGDFVNNMTISIQDFYLEKTTEEVSLIEKEILKEFSILKGKIKNESIGKEEEKERLIKDLYKIGFFNVLNMYKLMNKLLRSHEGEFSESEVLKRFVYFIDEDLNSIKSYSETSIINVEDISTYYVCLNKLFNNQYKETLIIDVLKECFDSVIKTNDLKELMNISLKINEKGAQDFCRKYINLEKLFEVLKPSFAINSDNSENIKLASPKLFGLFCWLYFDVFFNLSDKDFQYTPFKQKELFYTSNNVYSLSLVNYLVDLLINNKKDKRSTFVIQKTDPNGFHELFNMYLFKTLRVSRLNYEKQFELLDLFKENEKENLIALNKYFTAMGFITSSDILMKFINIIEGNSEIYFDLFTDDIIYFLSDVNELFAEKMKESIDYNNEDHISELLNIARIVSKEKYRIEGEISKDTLSIDEQLICLGNNAAINQYCDKLKLMGLNLKSRLDDKEVNRTRKNLIITSILLVKSKMLYEMLNGESFTLDLKNKEVKKIIISNEIFKRGFFARLTEDNIKFNFELKDLLDIIIAIHYKNIYDKGNLRLFVESVLLNSESQIEKYEDLVIRKPEYSTEAYRVIVDDYINL